MMRALSASTSIRIPHQLSSPLRKQAFPITTTWKEQTFFPQQPLSLRVVNCADESSSFRVVPLAAAAAVDKLRTDEKDEKEEVKSLLTLFLKELSLKDTMKFCKSVHFIDNLVSKLHNIQRIEFPVGRELTQVEIRDALIPSIESLVEENLDILVKRKKLPIPQPTINNSSLDSINPNDMVSVSSSNIQQTVGAFDMYSWKEKEPLIEFILQLGLLESKIPMIIHKCPELLKTSIDDVKSTVDYLHEMGLSKESICKIINIHPNILRFSIDDKLRRTAEYFHSMGIDPCVLLQRRPKIWERSLEHDLKPVTEFFLERGYSVEEIVEIVLKLPGIYACNVPKRLIPKWDFFLTLDTPRSELVKFPHYFGYSLEGRIKPRYARLRERGLELSLHAALSISNDDFEKIMNGEISKMRYRRGSLSVKSHAGLRS